MVVDGLGKILISKSVLKKCRANHCKTVNFVSIWKKEKNVTKTCCPKDSKDYKEDERTQYLLGPDNNIDFLKHFKNIFLKNQSTEP